MYVSGALVESSVGPFTRKLSALVEFQNGSLRHDTEPVQKEHCRHPGGGLEIPPNGVTLTFWFQVLKELNLLQSIELTFLLVNRAASVSPRSIRS